MAIQALVVQLVRQAQAGTRDSLACQGSLEYLDILASLDGVVIQVFLGYQVTAVSQASRVIQDSAELRARQAHQE